MVKKLFLLFLIAATAAGFAGCSLFYDGNGGNEKNKDIYAYPKTLNLDRGRLSVLPEYNGYSTDTFQVDLRSYDLTALELKDRLNDLMHSDFDNKTKWPYILPKGFDPKRIIEYGKNPGLGINELHKAGIDGRGVGVAIIGGPVLADHTEYKKQLKLYKELNFTSRNASPEGTAAASVLAGGTTGVSPGVDLYYVAVRPESNDESGSAAGDGNSEENNSQLSGAVDWIAGFNESLPVDNRIRVLCIQKEITTGDKDYPVIMESVKKAAAQGIFVVSTISDRLYDSEICFKGLGREALSDPDTQTFYLPGKSWENSFYTFGRYMPSSNTLFVPSDSRCTASPTGKRDYAFYPVSDWNLYLPYAAGLYALAWQVKPGITPEEFMDRALKTGDALEIVNKNINYTYKLKNIVNPTRLAQALKE